MNSEITHKSVSLISTVFNEEKSISRFLDSLMAQTRKPDEIVIVDGGSKDRTVEIIKDYIQRGMPIQLHEVPGANISKGRNIAIEKAKGEIIAATDAGCILDTNWLKHIVEPFERDPSIDVVSGFYYPVKPEKLLEKAISHIGISQLENVNPAKFLPSSRSIAFTKSVWKQSKGYPEWLYSSEDTLFDLKLKKMEVNFHFNPDAFVEWHVHDNLKDLFRKHFWMARGNGHNLVNLKKHIMNFSILLLWLFSICGIMDFPLSNYFPFFVLLLLVIIAFILGYVRSHDLKVAFIFPLVCSGIKLGELYGFPVGLYQRIKLGYASIQREYMKLND